MHKLIFRTKKIAIEGGLVIYKGARCMQIRLSVLVIKKENPIICSFQLHTKGALIELFNMLLGETSMYHTASLAPNLSSVEQYKDPELGENWIQFKAGTYGITDNQWQKLIEILREELETEQVLRNNHLMDLMPAWMLIMLSD